MSTSSPLPPSNVRNYRILAACLVLVASMVALSYAAVPLYDLFCRVTGFGGTTQRVASPSAVVLDRVMTVRFDANAAPGLPWEFQAVTGSTKVRLGETALIFYRATNRGSAPVTGTATFNVTPTQAGAYFNKIECFCFTEQTIAPGQSVDFPVTFFIDPAILEEPTLREVRTITLSYTFFPAKADATRTSALEPAAARP